MNPGATNSRLMGQTPQSAFVLARSQQADLLRHFGFRESPFGVTPDPEFLFWSQTHNTAFQALITSIESNLGFSVLLGRPGTGKTSLLFQLLAQYRESARTAFVFQTQCRAQDLIRHIAAELELPVASRDDVFLHQKINGMLLNEARAGRKVLIVIDEAQNLRAPSLEAVRLLSDFETGFSKLLNVVLSGSLRLRDMLLSPELSQLAQRISTLSCLEPLTEQEVQDYVRFRLSVVCSRANEGPFSSESLAEIAAQSEGIPRMINSICYRALVLAYNRGQASVSREVVNQAARNLDLPEPSTTDRTARRDFQKVEDAPVLNGVPSPIFSGRELGWEPPIPAFVETPSEPGVNQSSFAQTVCSPADAESQDINLRFQPVPAEAEQSGGIEVPVTQSERSGWTSPGFLAALVVLAFVSWIGWHEVRARTTTGGGQSGSEPELSAVQVKPSQHEGTSRVRNKTPQPLLRESNRLPSTNPKNGQSTEIQASTATDASPDLAAVSKIDSQPSAPEEPPVPSYDASEPKNSNNLALLATPNSAALPLLDAPKITSKTQASFSSVLVKVIKPDYPARAKLLHIEGNVELELTIDQNGNVQNIRGLRGNSILLQAAEEAARQWRYSPPIEGTAVTRVQFNFKLP